MIYFGSRTAFIGGFDCATATGSVQPSSGRSDFLMDKQTEFFGQCRVVPVAEWRRRATGISEVVA